MAKFMAVECTCERLGGIHQEGCARRANVDRIAEVTAERESQAARMAAVVDLLYQATGKFHWDRLTGQAKLTADVVEAAKEETAAENAAPNPAHHINLRHARQRRRAAVTALYESREASSPERTNEAKDG